VAASVAAAKTSAASTNTDPAAARTSGTAMASYRLR
jgi:hypothetical protein